MTAAIMFNGSANVNLFESLTIKNTNIQINEPCNFIYKIEQDVQPKEEQESTSADHLLRREPVNGTGRNRNINRDRSSVAVAGFENSFIGRD
jgi:hypothetical protein